MKSPLKKLEESKGVLEYIVYFLEAMTGHTSTTWEPAKGKGARTALREARIKRRERLLARRQQQGKQHWMVKKGRYFECTKCNRRAYSEGGRKLLELTECTTVV